MREAYHRGEVALGEPFKVYEANRGTEAQMYRQGRKVQIHLLKWVRERHALSKLVVERRRSPDPWGGWEIFVTYYGEAGNASAMGKWKAKRRHSHTL